MRVVVAVRPYEPVRKIGRRRSSSCTTGLFPTSDFGTLESEGNLDREFQIIMSVSPAVLDFVPQPETFAWVDEGKRCYTPDAWAKTVFGDIFFEVKPSEQLAKSPDLKGRMATIARECEARGAAFRIVTEREIKVEPLLSNSKSLWSAQRGVCAKELEVDRRRLSNRRFPMPLKDVADALGTEKSMRVRALLGRRILSTDLTTPLCPFSILRPGLFFHHDMTVLENRP